MIKFICLLSIVIIGFCSPTVAMTSEPATPPSAQSTITDNWNKLLQECIQAAPQIKNSVERNKFLRLMTRLQDQTRDLHASSNNQFLQQHNQAEWQAVSLKLKSRLTSATQNIADENDKKLVMAMLNALLQEAQKNLPADANTPPVVVKPSDLTPAEQGRQLYVADWLHTQLPVLKKQLGNFSPTVFISYAWGSTEKAFVSQFAKYLKMAGIQVRLDVEHNGLSTTINTGFVQELETVDYILVVGSKLYGDKAKLGKNNVVATETRIIADRNKRQPGRVLSILLSGDPREAFPPFMRDKVFVNFTDPKLYVQELDKVILAVCKYAGNHDEIVKTVKAIDAGAVKIQTLSDEQLIARYKQG